MTRTYRTVSGDIFEMNVASGTFLDRLTFPLFKKIGCFPKTRDDCQLVARVIHNFVHLQQYWSPSWKDVFDITFKKASPETLEWLEDVAEFFERANGLILEHDS